MSITAGSVTMSGTRADGSKFTVTGRDAAEAMRKAQAAPSTGTTVASAPTRTPSRHKTAADLQAESEMREKIKKGQFIPGYTGGRIKYSTGDGVKTFNP
jgi:hypothetical protein